MKFLEFWNGSSRRLLGPFENFKNLIDCSAYNAKLQIESWLSKRTLIYPKILKLSIRRKDDLLYNMVYVIE